MAKLRDNSRQAPRANNGKEEDPGLLLSAQLCFPLYAASRLMGQLYQPHLQALGLTYPQYLVMMALWNHGRLSAKQIGALLYLDSATLTQVLGNLAQAGYIVRERSRDDARTVLNRLTPLGRALKTKARLVPEKMGCELVGHEERLAILQPLMMQLVEVLAGQVARRHGEG